MNMINGDPYAKGYGFGLAFDASAGPYGVKVKGEWMKDATGKVWSGSQEEAKAKAASGGGEVAKYI